MISGLFVALGARAYGVARLRRELVNTSGTGLQATRVYDWVLTYLVPVEFVAMFGWWMYQTVTVYDPEGWWRPLRVYSLGTCLLQWGTALGLLWLFNRRLAQRSVAPHATLEVGRM